MKAKKDPSPEQIEQLTAEIRATWTAAERLRRLRADWRPMFTRCDGEKLEIEAADYERHHEQRAELQTAGT
ncbi:MAG: hypothetical protein NT138_05465 [Planctomycetales bacterium]|nr:hypothetical protein [Planctomycetales bacterium]